MKQAGSMAEGRLSDWISLGVLASWVPRDAVDDAVEATGRGAKRKGGKLPPHVMVYFAMALALLAEEDYEETWTRLSETLADWGCWGDSQGTVTTGGLTQARQRLGHEPVKQVFAQAAVPPAIGPVASKGSGEQSLARGLYPRLKPDWLLMADRNFYNWQDWCTAADTGAALLWRAKADLRLPPLEFLPDGSYRSVLVNPKVKGKARDKILEAARAGEDLDPGKARYIRVIEYE